MPEGWVMTGDGPRPPPASTEAPPPPEITMPRLDTSTSDAPPPFLTKKAKKVKKAKPTTVATAATVSTPREVPAAPAPPVVQATDTVVPEASPPQPMEVDEETLALEAQMAAIAQKLAEKKAAQAAAAEAEAATKAAATAAAAARVAALEAERANAPPPETSVATSEAYSSGSEDSSDSEDDLDDEDLEMEEEEESSKHDDASELQSEIGESSVVDGGSDPEDDEEDDEFLSCIRTNQVEAASAEAHAAAVEERNNPPPQAKNDKKTKEKWRFARKTMLERDAADENWEPSTKQKNIIEWYERIDLEKLNATGIIEVPRKKRFKTFDMMMRAKQKLAEAERGRKNRQEIRDINSRLRFFKRQELEQNREESAARREAKLARKTQRRKDRFNKRVNKANKKLNAVVKNARDREQTRFEKRREKAQAMWAKLQGSKRSKVVDFGGGLIKIHFYQAPEKPLPPPVEGYKRFFCNDERFLTQGALHIPAQNADPYSSTCHHVDFNPRPGKRGGTRSHKRKADMDAEEEQSAKKQALESEGTAA